MQVEFAFAASSAAAVATHQAWFVRSVETGMSATSMIVALPEETDIASAAMKIGMHVAYAGGGTKAVFVADPKILADVAVNGSAAGAQGSSAGLPEAVRGHAVFFDAAGRAHAKGNPKMGVMTYDVRKAGREARHASVAANVTGS